MAEGAAKPRKTKTPRYLQLAGELRDEILSGEYAPGKNFPTETVLCKRYDVSRFTVREALRRLQNEGLIERKRGSGTQVQPAAAIGGALHQPLSNVGELLQYARDSKVGFGKGSKGDLPPDVAEHIAADTSGKWACFHGVRTVPEKRRAIAVTDAYFHETLGDTIDQLDMQAGTLFSQIERLTGIRVGKVTQDIQAVAASDQIAKELEIDTGSPVLRILRCYFDPKDRLFEISVSFHPGDRFVYSMHIDVDD